MKLHSLFMRLAVSVATALIAHTASAAEPLPVRVLLVGDSTMAPQTGYGDALCRRFRPNVTCLNLAKGGRSSASYRAEGSWDKVLDLLHDGGQDSAQGNAYYGKTYVLIQFGHNDQPGKPGRSTDLATEFPVNMAHFAQQVKALGAIPVLVTPLARRMFQDKLLRNDLRPWAEATIKVATAEHVVLLDLNADSAAAVQTMGMTEADTLAMAPPTSSDTAAGQTTGDHQPASKPKGENYRGFDRTHLGAKGATLFSGMVAQELAQAVPDIAADFKAED